MKVVSITGISSGVGATTVAAQLSSILATRKWHVIAFDFSPQNALRLHFGMKWEDGNGLIPNVLSGKPWNEAAYRCENGVDFLPFGKCGEQEVAGFEHLLQQEQDWLESRLGELEADDSTCILIDCSHAGRAFRSQAHALSDLIFVVLEADTLSYAALAESPPVFAPDHAGKVIYLLNGFDPTRELDRDIAELLRVDIGVRMCPVTIHRDESVREALASKLSLDAYAPYSQASDDFAALSTWLVARLAHEERRTP
ncbi:cellulose synthase operon protein YhjQ [Ferrigenium kumadai]|uniref:Cellulose synthase operon protein YhjQ n=1 Tax=Ferrigenium kumadai TaxID=1682490 RepID=A0AAN1VZL1_9PROT|nr:cellulose biosynthesis protein BcsQ [Ferrigenium kumadai]BBI99544.1 cellulose synthase operon protein YhjQ [Ferrigenium kumadai]